MLEAIDALIGSMLDAASFAAVVGFLLFAGVVLLVKRAMAGRNTTPRRFGPSGEGWP